MPQYVPGLGAPEVETRLLESLVRLQQAESQALLWFCEIRDRRLYRELGYSSIWQFALVRLGFSRTRTAYFLRLAKSFHELPNLRDSVAAGEITWTQAREVVKVATPRTEKAWIRRARSSSRRDLERQVAHTRARSRRRAGSGQEQLAIPGEPTTPAARGEAREVLEAPVTVTLRFSPEQFARWETALGVLLAAGEGADRESLALQAAEIAADITRVNSGNSLSGNTFSDPAIPTIAAGKAEDHAPAGPGSSPAASRAVTAGSIGGHPSRGATPGAVPGACGASLSPSTSTATTGHAPGEESLAPLASTTPSAPSPGAHPLAPLASAVPAPLASTTSPSTSPGEYPLAPVASAVPAPSTHAARAASGRARIQVYVRRCPACEAAAVVSSRGELPLRETTFERLLCDARVRVPGGRNTARIPDRVRRAVLERDGYRCRAPGCGRTRFVEVHHRALRGRGGGNALGNLITLCSGCHHVLHERERGERRAGRKSAERRPAA